MKKEIYKICDDGVRNLARAVLVQAARDIKRGSKRAKNDVENGGLDLYLGLMGVDIAAQNFIHRSMSVKQQKAERKCG